MSTTSASSIFSKSSLIDGMAGWCSGAAAVICVQPVDTILTRRQAGHRPLAAASATATTTGAATTLRPVLFWRGSSAMISAVPLQNALLMAGYGWGKRADSSHWGVFVGGCAGGVLQSFLMSPVELIKVRQQVHVTQSLPAILRATGWNSLQTASTMSAWKGLGATMLRDGIPHGVWFVSYEVAKERLAQVFVDADSSTAAEKTSYHETFTVPLLSGAVAATVAWGVGYPADLIKTRIQASAVDTGIWDVTQELMREPGGLYRGFGLKLLRSVPASMIGFCVYEQVSKHLFSTFGKEE